MPNKPSDIVTNILINKGSILLLFKGADAVIARNWQQSDKPENIVDARPALRAKAQGIVIEPGLI